ncbi:MAG: GntR family transcriptional regulator [Acidobacteriota bacterium]
MAKKPASQPGNLADAAYRYILDRILRGALAMGAEISRRQIAGELGMSVLPVSEALQRLEQEALVESDRRVGTRVRIPTPQDIRGYCTVREALETEAARLFQERARAKERDRLMVLAGELDKLYESAADHAKRFSEARLYQLRLEHKRFHLLIAQGAACPYLETQIEKNQNLVFSSFYDRLSGERRLPYQWHAALATALCGPDVDAADRAARRHVRHHLEEIMYRLEPFFTLNPARIAASLGRGA